MHKETRVYYIYKYKYILYILFCKSCFELQMYGCNASWVIEQDVRKYNDLYPQRNDCRKWNKTSLSMHCVFCHYIITQVSDARLKHWFVKKWRLLKTLICAAYKWLTKYNAYHWILKNVYPNVFFCLFFGLPLYYFII